MSCLSLTLRRKPETPIEWLAVRVKDYLYLPDAAPLYVTVGALAANLLEGPPVWLMLSGPPGCGKTILLEALLGIDRLRSADSIKGESAFLSGTANKDKAKDATGGLLRLVGTHGGLVIKDFTGILSLPPDRVREVLDVFRQVYDGSWARSIGSEGGRTLSWGPGKLAVLAGVTGDIDRYHQVSATLGERWVFWRFGDCQEGFCKAKAALRNANHPEWKDHLRELVQAFFAAQELAFGKPGPRRDLTDKELVRTVTMAAVAARCRSGVMRDIRTQEIIGARETEEESRLAVVVGQLLVGLDLIGVDEKTRWRLLGKVCLDSMPRIRHIVLERVKAGGVEGAGMEQLREAIGCSYSTAYRAVEDLEVHGVLVKERLAGAKEHRVKLSAWMAREWKKGWRGI
jgi:energy-coupling factor transporter ATP-binding protein EcfA2